MRLYIYLLDFMSRISYAQKRIGWSRTDWALLVLTSYWLLLCFLYSFDYIAFGWDVLGVLGVPVVMAWTAQTYFKYLPNWKNYLGGPASLEAPRGSDVED
jgi:hypothetical protein